MPAVLLMFLCHHGTQKLPKDPYLKSPTTEAFLVFKLLFSSPCSPSLFKGHVCLNDSSWGNAGQLLRLIYTNRTINQPLEPNHSLCTNSMKVNSNTAIWWVCQQNDSEWRKMLGITLVLVFVQFFGQRLRQVQKMNPLLQPKTHGSVWVLIHVRSNKIP